MNALQEMNVVVMVAIMILMEHVAGLEVGLLLVLTAVHVMKADLVPNLGIIKHALQELAQIHILKANRAEHAQGIQIGFLVVWMQMMFMKAIQVVLLGVIDVMYNIG